MFTQMILSESDNIESNRKFRQSLGFQKYAVIRVSKNIATETP